MSRQAQVHLALFMVTLIYGATFTIAKEVMPTYIGPFGFIVVRVWSALAIIWLTHAIFIKSEKIERKDFQRLALCAIFGVAVNMLLFFKGLSITTPISSAIIMVTTPLFVAIFAFWLLKEEITFNKILGLILGLTGAVLILLYPNFKMSGSGFMGDFYVMLNAISYSYYLIIVKPLLTKYQPLTVLKWLFLIGGIMVLPFGFTELQAVDWANLPGITWVAIVFIIIGPTYLAYLLNGWALKYVNSSVVGAYVYLQPVLATLIAIGLGKDSLSIPKIIFTLLIFLGVYLVSFKTQAIKWPNSR